MKTKISRIAAPVLAAIGMLVIMLAVAQFATAAPPAIPTPVSNPGERATSSTVATFCNAVVKIADGRCTNWAGANYNILDLQYVIDQGSSPNTVTLKIQYSNNGINWVDGAAIVSANVADASDLVQLNNYGRYTNIYADVTNTTPVTITVIAVGK